MKTLSKNHTNTAVLFGILAIVAVVTIAPHAFAQQQGISLGGPYGTPQPTDQGQSFGWGVGMATAAVATGVGMWSIAKRR